MEPNEKKESISDRKLAANRENAKKSTGPKSSRGKTVSSLNAVTHGLFLKKTVAAGPPLMENQADFLTLVEGLRVHYDPVGVYEDVLVQEIAVAKWKAVRLERFEAAGVSERVLAAIAAERTRNAEDRWNTLQKGIPRNLRSAGYSADRPHVTAQMLAEQIDLLGRLKADDARFEEEPDFLAYVWLNKHGGDEAGLPPEEQLRNFLAELPAAEIDELKPPFQSTMEAALEGMWDLRPKSFAYEAAMERALVPGDAEMNRVVRYSTYLTRLEERKVEMLERLQAARREKEGRR